MRARDNPFATARLHQIPFRFPDGLAWPSFLERLAQMNCRGALVGPEGSGKTTLLEQLKPVLAEHGFDPLWLRLDREQQPLLADFWKILGALAGPRIILFDGAEQLTRSDWNRFLRLAEPAAGLIITTHNFGRLSTLLECTTSLALFRGVVAELLGSAQAAEALPLASIYKKHSGNLRLALLELYDWFARPPDH